MRESAFSVCCKQESADEEEGRERMIMLVEETKKGRARTR